MALSPAEIKTLRKRLGENTGTFGARFARSGRTVEDWEQGRRLPDALVARLLEELQAKIDRKGGRPRKTVGA